jgi:hypothetical protein
LSFFDILRPRQMLEQLEIHPALLLLGYQEEIRSLFIAKRTRLGSVAGPVIQATGRSEFKDGLGSGDFVSGYSYHMSVRTRLSDQTKQTKFQS